MKLLDINLSRPSWMIPKKIKADMVQRAKLTGKASKPYEFRIGKFTVYSGVLTLELIDDDG